MVHIPWTQISDALHIDLIWVHAAFHNDASLSVTFVCFGHAAQEQR